MHEEELRQRAEVLLSQLYDPITSKRKALSARKYDRLYEEYKELELSYEFNLGEEERPEYSTDETNDLLDDACAALA